MFEASNRGLGQRAGATRLSLCFRRRRAFSAGWLTELSAAAHSEERAGFAWPLSSDGFGLARAATGAEHSAGTDETEIATRAAAGLPRWTTSSSILGGCVYLRGQILDAVGLLDTGFSSRQAAIIDWVMRAQTLGFFGKRANHVCVDLVRSDCPEGARSFLSLADRAVLDQRHPHLAHEAASFEQSIDGRLTRHAIEFVKTGKLRVAYDIRHVPRRNVGICTSAINLAESLSRIPQIELSFLVDTRDQADGLFGRIITVEEWRDEFAVIHKPAQFLNRRELEIPFSSSSHVVITYQDSMTPDASTVSGDDSDLDACGTTSSLSLLCASGILAQSQGSREKIALGAEPRSAPRRSLSAPIERMAESTFAVYRRAVLRPTERSLQMRRLMREAILSWSRPSSRQTLLREEQKVRADGQAMGVRAAWNSLNSAIGRRVGREVRRFHSRHVRSKA